MNSMTSSCFIGESPGRGKQTILLIIGRVANSGYRQGYSKRHFPIFRTDACLYLDLLLNFRPTHIFRPDVWVLSCPFCFLFQNNLLQIRHQCRVDLQLPDNKPRKLPLSLSTSVSGIIIE